MATTNYSLPVFTAEGTPDLIGVYNAAMVAIDQKLKELNDSISNTAKQDAVNNAAMEAIDQKLKELNDSISDTTKLDAVKSDVANLKSSVSGINSNITGINSKITGINSSISGINSKITPGTSDKSLTVEQLNGAKLTAGGIVYYKKAQ